MSSPTALYSSVPGPAHAPTRRSLARTHAPRDHHGAARLRREALTQSDRTPCKSSEVAVKPHLRLDRIVFHAGNRRADDAFGPGWSDLVAMLPQSGSRPGRFGAVARVRAGGQAGPPGHGRATDGNRMNGANTNGDRTAPSDGGRADGLRGLCGRTPCRRVLPRYRPCNRAKAGASAPRPQSGDCAERAGTHGMALSASMPQRQTPSKDRLALSSRRRPPNGRSRTASRGLRINGFGVGGVRPFKCSVEGRRHGLHD